MTRLTGAVLAIAASALLLSACGGAAGSGPPPTKEIGKNDINPKPRDQVKDGGVLQWGVDAYPANFNWLHVDATDGDIPAVVQSFMPTPAISDANGTWSPNPAYLTSFTVVSQDPQKVEYKLNPKAHWSDGSPITWADYQSQWQALNGKNPAFQVQNTAGYASISDISRGADDYSFTATYSPKLAEWTNLFPILYPKSMTSSPEQFNSGWKDGPKLTGGPFKIDNLDLTGKNVTVVRDTSFWGQQAKLDKIVFKYYASAQVEVDGLASGAYDFASVASDIDAYKRTSVMPGVSERRANLPNYRAVVLNGAGNSILADAGLRRAIIKGIDRDPIAKAEISQLIPEAKPLGSHIYMAGFPGYQDNSVGYTYDPKAAAKELDELGWKLSGQTRAKDGKPLKIRDVIPAGTKSALDEAKLVQQQLAAIGVQVEITQYDRNTFFEQHITPGDFDIAHYAQMWDFAPPVNIAHSYFAVGSQQLSNPGRVGSQQVNDLLDQASAELDLGKRQQLMNQADKLLWELGHSLPLYQRPSIVATRSTLANMGNAGLASFQYADMGWQK
ncbi:ABC transporter family substrate-binding protein [Kutzneria albida]|uniref:ABC transporter family substrate-binding protein n=1 Tax=Kutzneria albida TaxID=43357 RepID=UPI0004B44CDD|nr:ABC transporter family substrate-binding protein [Kutzneria albida]